MTIETPTATRFDLFADITTKTAGDGEKKPTITAIASSTHVDRGNDRFALSALQQMKAQFPGLSLFVNHRYSIPEDLVGVIKTATIEKKDSQHELEVTAELDTSNPRTVALMAQLDNGARLGVSVGVIVKGARFVKVDNIDVMEITDIELLELSIVGLPANREAWVTGALKAASFALGGTLLDEKAPTTSTEAADGVPADDTATEVYKALYLIHKARAVVAEQEASEWQTRAVDFAQAWEQLADLSVGRKIDPEASKVFQEMAARYPYLDPSITNRLARDREASR